MKKILSLTLAGIALSLFAIALPVSAADHGPAEFITLVPESAAISAGDSLSFSVTATDAQHKSWDVSSSATITIEKDAGGSFLDNVYTSENVGVWTISATAGNFSDTSKLYVSHGEATIMTLTASATNVAAGEVITLTTTFEDSVGNSWDVTGVTNFSTTEDTVKISSGAYTPITTGEWDVTAKAGSFTKSARITVTPAPAEFLTLSPYPGPIAIDVNTTKAFTSAITDKYGNEVTSSSVTWGTADTSIAEINNKGVVTAKKRGMTTVTASIDDILLTIPVEVKGPVEAITNTTNEEGQVLGESVEAESVTPPGETSDEQMSEEVMTEETTETEEETCEPVALWVTIIILLAYALVLAGYYFLIRKEEDKSWWIFPVLLTVIGVIIWAKYFCEGSYPWWPWTLVLVGVIVTGLMRKDKDSGDKQIPQKDSQEKPPENQPPMF